MIKLLATTFLIGFSTLFTSLVGAGAYLMTGGIAVCEVETPEIAFKVPVPTRIVDAGLLVTWVGVPREELADVRREIEPYLPMIEEMIDTISRVPDGSTLVSVETEDANVLVQRRDGRFHVDVEADDATVHVSLPARSLRRISGELSLVL